MAKTEFNFDAIARVWEKLRNSIKIDWSKATKKDVDRALSRRSKEMRDVLKGQKTLKGTTKAKADRELKNIQSLQKNPVYNKGWGQMKKLGRTSFRQSSSKGTAYNRTYQKWTPAQEDFIRQRKGMPAKALANSFNSRFGSSVVRSPSGIAAKIRRLG